MDQSQDKLDLPIKKQLLPVSQQDLARNSEMYLKSLDAPDKQQDLVTLRDLQEKLLHQFSKNTPMETLPQWATALNVSGQQQDHETEMITQRDTKEYDLENTIQGKTDHFEQKFQEIEARANDLLNPTLNISPPSFDQEKMEIEMHKQTTLSKYHQVEKMVQGFEKKFTRFGMPTLNKKDQQ